MAHNRSAHVAVALLSALLAGTPAAAEIYECNGVYSNSPECGAKGTQVMHESSGAGPSEMSRKRSLIHDLRMKNIRAQTDHGVSLNLSETEVLCLKVETPVDDCRKEVERQDDRLEERIVERAKIAADKSKESGGDKTTKVEQNSTTVNISQPRVIVGGLGRGGFGGRGGGVYGPGQPPTNVYIPPTGPQPPQVDLPPLSPGGAPVRGSSSDSRVPLSQRVPIGQ